MARGVLSSSDCVTLGEGLKVAGCLSVEGLKVSVTEFSSKPFLAPTRSAMPRESLRSEKAPQSRHVAPLVHP
ncbi:hypothetical protein NDU88_000113 [Pleurodeles waltl]|uniref:Uncharacterized protein n=1 Tax=Pleurodeles waltl TaxID=8319 RepID=A0AAV7P313_PLEWA|nr:hypothetical protein NDU88_000113 [Pleurodeles waltl]